MDRITATTTLTGLIGSPVQKSLSPVIHNAAFRLLGLDYVYLAFEVKDSDLQQAVAGLRALGVRGFNVTMPHKQNVMRYLNSISEEARLIGSVNTVVNRDGYLTGYNTDGKGFVRSLLEKGISVRGRRIVLAGAGGSARSVAVQLALDGAERIIILNRTVAKVTAVSNLINENIKGCRAEAYELNEQRLAQSLGEADIFVNCTPLGMYNQIDESVISDAGMLRADTVVCDLVYQPLQTKLLRMAEQKGCRTVNGLGMLVWQGALAFEMWTGQEMPVENIYRLGILPNND